MDADLQHLGEELISTAARMVRWVPTEGITLSLSAVRLLARLKDNGPSRISDLAQQERSSQPTITNHVKRLEAAGYVHRTADPRDARAWRIALTQAGEDQLASMRRIIGGNLEPYLSRLDTQEHQALREGIEAMRRLMALR